MPLIVAKSSKNISKNFQKLFRSYTVNLNTLFILIICSIFRILKVSMIMSTSFIFKTYFKQYFRLWMVSCLLEWWIRLWNMWRRGAVWSTSKLLRFRWGLRMCFRTISWMVNFMIFEWMHDRRMLISRTDPRCPPPGSNELRMLPSEFCDAFEVCV